MRLVAGWRGRGRSGRAIRRGRAWGGRGGRGGRRGGWGTGRVCGGACVRVGGREVKRGRSSALFKLLLFSCRWSGEEGSFHSRWPLLCCFVIVEAWWAILQAGLRVEPSLMPKRAGNRELGVGSRE